LITAAALGSGLGSCGGNLRGAAAPGDPFSLGVASGDPAPDGVVLWTRLAPRPLDPDGGMPARPVDVSWSLAEDEGLTRGLRTGNAVALPQLAHSVHVEVAGLDPDRVYWYRFRAGDALSPLGRTRTAPLPGALPSRLRIAVASCQHLEQGLFTAYEHMLRDDVDVVFHLGDYIYEGAGQDKKVRRHA